MTFYVARNRINYHENLFSINNVGRGYIIMKRILLMFVKNFLYLPGMLIRLWRCAGNVDNYTEEERYALLKDIVVHANNGGNVKIEAQGVENIPQDNGFIFFPNHQGMYDVLAILDACPKPFSVVAKKEVANVPLLRSVFKIMKALFIDREDVRQSMQIIMQVTKEVKEGRNYIIFPEGTRSKNGNKVGEFKGGSFKAATKAKCPIVPVALIDSFKPFDTNSVEQVTVQVHILKPLLHEEYKDMKTVDIAEEVKRRVVEKIEENLVEKIKR